MSANLLPGDIIALKSWRNTYLRADNAPIPSDLDNGFGTVNEQTGIGPWEKWTVIQNNDGTYSFQSWRGTHLRADNTPIPSDLDNGFGTVNQQTGIGPWEKWTVIQNSDGTYSFQSWRGTHLRADNTPIPSDLDNGFGTINEQTGIGPWEKWTIINVAGLTILSGNNQTAQRVLTASGIAIANFAPLSVVLYNSAGQPLSGQQITWSSPSHPPAMAVQMEPSGASPCIVTTDSNGNATLNKMGGSSIQAYYADGNFTVVASYGSTSATFNLTVGGTAQPTFTGTILSGNSQSVVRTGTQVPGGEATFAPLQVQVDNANGQPASGVQVGFSVGSAPGGMAVQLEPAGAQATTVNTDSNGIATLNYMGGNSMSCYYASGSFTLVASVAGGNVVTFNETVADTPPPPTPVANATLTILSGNNQTAQRVLTASGIAIADYSPLSVVLHDSASQPLSGQQITWSSPSHPPAMAVQMEPSGASPCIVTTDSNGNATLNKMGGSSVQAYYADGNFTIVASYGSTSATFNLTVGGTAQPTLTATILLGNNQSVARTGTQVPEGEATFAPLQVQVDNANGQPASGIQVGFSVGSAPGGMAVQLEPAGAQATTVNTDSNGIATLNQMGGNSMSCYYASGSFTLVASVTGGNQVTFNETVSS